MKDIMFNSKLIKRLTFPETRSKSGCGLWAEHGATDFYHVVREIVLLVNYLPEERRDEVADAIYRLILKVFRDKYIKDLAAVDPKEDRGMTIPEMWWPTGWDEEAELVGLDKIIVAGKKK